jgi:soluble lytic murein transglycosylase-like protein
VKRKTFLWLLVFNAVGAGFAYSPGVDAARAIRKEETKSFENPGVVSSREVLCTNERSRYSKLVQSLSRKYGLDWRLVAAVVATESDFNPCAVSDKGAVGLMQLMPETAEMYSIELKDLSDPEKNIRAGVQHLKMLYEVYNGNLELTIAAYNAGQGAVQKYGGVPPFVETQAYVKKVLEIRSDLTTGSAQNYSISMR